ncbi:glycosyl hydrolase [Kordiimonas sediminis]|uniref:Glycosyl hydrolase n=1 Tax=Kordiimonas sediminis TaxID=1735581 RepID=A0A919AKW1_9PROT|nr:DUF1080 domain-containing protein [Kordiimonas sediminis]GHF13376.1 glycosyl hydrolase [Kordiimonas sediminis]
MKAFLAAALLFSTTAACAEESTLLDASQWRRYQSTDISAGWEAKGETLRVIAKGAGDLISKETYRNFDLTFEWKISEGGNSGVFFHVQETPDLKQVYFSGPEYQLLDNVGRDEPPLEQAGALFALYAPTEDTTKPVGEFNTSRLIVQGDTVEHWLNGKLVVSYDMGSQDFKAKVAASKFSNWPAFAAKREGHIALQDHGDPVTFRNIRITRLPD